MLAISSPLSLLLLNLKSCFALYIFLTYSTQYYSETTKPNQTNRPQCDKEEDQIGTVEDKYEAAIQVNIKIIGMILAFLHNNDYQYWVGLEVSNTGPEDRLILF